MQFYEPFILWRALRKLDKDTYADVSWAKFYDSSIQWSVLKEKGGVGSGAAMEMESRWLRDGCPYYKLWPGVFDQFASTRMDIDTKFLKPPHKVFAIYFPQTDVPLLNFKIKGDTFFVTSILVEHFTSTEINKCRKEVGLLKPLQDIFKDKAFSHLNIDEYNTGLIKVRIDFKSQQMADRYIDHISTEPEFKQSLIDMNPPGQLFRNIPVVPNTTIEETIGDFVDVPAMGGDFLDETVPASIIETCFRILIGIYFISTGSQKVLEYDVLARHLEAYRRMRDSGDNTGCKDYEARAKKKGKFGWNVGPDKKDRYLILPKGVTYDEAMRDAGSRELLYQHTRGGHWHLYWVGHRGGQMPIVKYVEETTVRPDLPIRPLKR